MTFNLLTRNKVPDSSDLTPQPILIQNACEKLGIEYREINVDETPVLDLPELGYEDMLYRNAASKRAVTFERSLINEKCRTFYKNYTLAFDDRASSFYQNKLAGVPVIPSFGLLPRDRDEQDRMLESLGGYPVILKILGGSKGVGVMRADSSESLRSMVDYVSKTKVNILLRKFIDHEYYARLIVVGDRVVASNKTFVPSGEFRSNTTENIDENRHPFEFDDLIQSHAVAAVHSIGREFGGVDILFDKNDTPYVAEVNFPCQFNYAQKITGIDIAEEMVRHLSEK